jgi:hypothetical protein
MQQTTPQPPQAGTPVVVQYTNAELNALVAKRVELKAQLEAVTNRRNELSLQGPASNASTREFQSQLRTLEERAGRLQNDILRTDDAIADAMARGLATTPAPGSQPSVPPEWQTSTQPALAPGRAPIDLERGMLLLSVVFVIAGVFIWRIASSRAAKKFARPAPDQSHRFEQLQQSVDVIAHEVERIAEGQRYVTKILNKSLQPALGAGNAEPIGTARRSEAPLPARDRTP